MLVPKFFRFFAVVSGVSADVLSGFFAVVRGVSADILSVLRRRNTKRHTIYLGDPQNMFPLQEFDFARE